MFAFGFVSGVAFVLLAAGYAVAVEAGKKVETRSDPFKAAKTVNNPWDVEL